MIHVIRGQKVMVDADLAALYGVQTGALNQAVDGILNGSPRISPSVCPKRSLNIENHNL